MSVLAAATDVSRHASVEALADRTYDAFGRVDVLCNNAGVCGDAVNWSWRHPIEDWRQVLDVNLGGVINGVHVFVPRMLEQGGEAWIMNTASMGGLASPPFLAPYVASKAAVIGLSESLDRELRLAGAAIRVSVLCPGSVRTAINQPLRADRPRPPGAEDAAPAAFRARGAQGIENGLDAATVAEQAVACMLEGRFFLFTHPEPWAPVEMRLARMRADLR